MSGRANYPDTVAASEKYLSFPLRLQRDLECRPYYDCPRTASTSGTRSYNTKHPKEALLVFSGRWNHHGLRESLTSSGHLNPRLRYGLECFDKASIKLQSRTQVRKAEAVRPRSHHEQVCCHAPKEGLVARLSECVCSMLQPDDTNFAGNQSYALESICISKRHTPGYTAALHVLPRTDPAPHIGHVLSPFPFHTPSFTL